MKRAFGTTLVMAIIAAVAAAGAASVYPWPETVVVSEAVNKPLFDELDTRSVRSIRIMQYSADQNNVDQILVRRQGERWTLPTNNNYLADNAAQISQAVNLLLDRTVLEKKSDNQEDHVEYGVVDPADFQNTTNRSSLGKKIVLSDRNNRELASLIVGLPVKNDPKRTKHYVRVPGQPSVYVVEIDASLLKTDFQAWVNPNLFRLTRQSRPIDITIDNYRIDPENLAAAKRQPVYQSTITVGQNDLKIDLLTADDAGELASATPAPAQRQLLQRAFTSIVSVPFSEVQSKDKRAAKSLRKQSAQTDRAAFASLADFGFRPTEFQNEAWQFDSSNGSTSIRTIDGVIVTAHFGTIDNKSRNRSLKLNHYLLMTASFDESLLPAVEELDSDEPTEDQNKAYLRKVAARDKQLASGRQRAAELNESFAKWYYTISEDVVSALRPDLKEAP